MASEQLRKKWTIFMGDRETTPQELEAMREPVMRERRQRQEQEDYLARVRVKAEERAREILGAAYAERQKVLSEAREAVETQARQAAESAAAIKQEAQSVLAEAHAERDKARALREEAAQVLERSRHEGYDVGMEQAGTEMQAFRADFARMIGGVLRGLEGQREAMCAAWREELVDLTRVAVEAGTHWVLQASHREILRNLVLDSLHQLEDRMTVTVRVHPDDEEVVGDMFKAAREQVPELRQWIVEGDSTLEPGDMVAESVSGSVEHLRAYYRELVGNILDHLTLPQSSEEAQADAALTATIAGNEARLADVFRETGQVRQPEPTVEAFQEPSPDGVRIAAPTDVASPGEAVMPAAPEACAPVREEQGVTHAERTSLLAGVREAAASSETSQTPQHQGEAFAGEDAEEIGEQTVPTEQASVATESVAAPTLAELEDELFAVPDDAPTPSAEASNVFTQGGFLPGAGRSGAASAGAS